MKLSRTVTYAICAIVELARSAPELPVPCRQLAQRGELPERFLLQVLRGLVKSGLLHSTRGVVGGYYLTRPPDQITLREIVDAFHSPQEPELSCLEKVTPYGRSIIKRVLHESNELARERLGQLTVAHLLHSGDATGQSRIVIIH